MKQTATLENNKRAIIYARVSTDDQRGNNSIPSQVQECKRYIENRGYTLIGNRFVDLESGQDAASGIPAFVDDFSSRELYRPALDDAYDYLESYGYDVVVVYAVDRLDRYPEKLMVHKNLFREKGAVIEYVTQTFSNDTMGEMMETNYAYFARIENESRSERFIRGKRQKAKRGFFVSGPAPYGFEPDKTSQGGLKVNEEEAETVRWIYETYANCESSLEGILLQLNHSRAKPRKGGKWQKSSLHKILINTA